MASETESDFYYFSTQLAQWRAKQVAQWPPKSTQPTLARYERNAWPNISEMSGTMTSEISKSALKIWAQLQFR